MEPTVMAESKKYEEMTPQEQFEYRCSDFGVTYFNGVRWEKDEAGNRLRDGVVVELADGTRFKDGYWIKGDRIIGRAEDYMIQDGKLVQTP
jgi:hypothetical protein